MSVENLKIKLRVAAIQIKAYFDKQKTIRFAQQMIDLAAKSGCQLVVLPEGFAGPYANEFFDQYSEKLESENSASLMMKQCALKYKLYIAGGIIEKVDNMLYNRVLVYNPEGFLITSYIKIHLSKVTSTNATQTTSEADYFQPGNQLGIFNINIDQQIYKIGIVICFDLRFENLIRNYATEHQCDLIIVPSAFLYWTGELHWEILLRSRAIDNQLYTLGANHTRDSAGPIEYYGNSMIVDPWGQVLARLPSAGELGGAFIYADIDKDLINDVRNRIRIRELKKPYESFQLLQKSRL